MSGGLVVVVEGKNGRRRIFLLTSKQEGVWKAFLATNFVEAATDLDLIMKPDGYPVPLVFHGELYWYVADDQVVKTVGTIPVDAVQALTLALFTDGESLQAFDTGFPLRPTEDFRRSHIERELDELDNYFCYEWMDGGQP